MSVYSNVCYIVTVHVCIVLYTVLTPNYYYLKMYSHIVFLLKEIFVQTFN